MDFAPYQDENPEIERALSPPPRRSLSISPNLRSPKTSLNLPRPEIRNGYGNIGGSEDLEAGNVGAGLGASRVDEFSTSLGFGLGLEAAAAYLLLPPAAGVFLLLTEHKSDYVRLVCSISRDFGRNGDIDKMAND